MEDHLIRGYTDNEWIRAFAVTAGGLTEEARQIHNTSPVVTAALGRMMSAALMMGAMMKNERDLLTLKIDGAGPMRGILVTADSLGNVKGYPYEPAVIIPANDKGKLDVSGAIGAGMLSVISDIGMKEPYVGQVELVSGEIAEDIAYYYASSEQVPSSVGLGVLMNRNNTVNCAGGFIIQLMPGCPDDIVDELESTMKGVDSVTNLLREGRTPEDILRGFLDRFGFKAAEKRPVRFRCDCTRERVERALISVGRKELKSMISDGKEIEVNCHFCGKRYGFSPSDLEALYAQAVRD